MKNPFNMFSMKYTTLHSKFRPFCYHPSLTGMTINRHRVRYVQRLTTLKLLNKEKMPTPTGHGDCATDHHKFHNLSPTADPYSPQALTRQFVQSRQNKLLWYK